MGIPSVGEGGSSRHGLPGQQGWGRASAAAKHPWRTEAALTGSAWKGCFSSQRQWGLIWLLENEKFARLKGVKWPMRQKDQHVKGIEVGM